FLSTPYLHDDRAFQHVKKRMCIVAMDWVRTTRWILHGDHQTFFAGNVRQVFRRELSDLRFQCLLRIWCCLCCLRARNQTRRADAAGQETRQRQNQFCERHTLKPFTSATPVTRWRAPPRDAHAPISSYDTANSDGNRKYGLRS